MATDNSIKDSLLITPSTDTSKPLVTTTPTSTSTGSSDSSYNADYNDLSKGVEDIEGAVKNVNESINECNGIIKDIFNESTFMGPFADYCYGTWNGLQELTVSTNSTLDTSAKVLDSNSEAYQESDKATGEKVGSV